MNGRLKKLDFDGGFMSPLRSTLTSPSSSVQEVVKLIQLRRESPGNGKSLAEVLRQRRELQEHI